MNQAFEVFVKVVEERNFSKAAKQLHMSQPAVSQYIRSLENELGVQLLERTNKYVRLNKAGKIVYHHAKEMTEIHEKMRHLVEDLNTQAIGKLSVGASYTFGEYILPDVIAELKDSFPNIKPTVTIANTTVIAELVASHQLDVGIVEGPFKEMAELESEIFAEDQMVIFTSPNNILTQSKKQITIDQLAEQSWILREDGSGTRKAAENYFREYTFYPEDVLTFSSTQSIKTMVEASTGTSLLSKWAIQKELHYGDLQMLNVKGMPLLREFSILTSSPFQTKALSTFIELLKSNKTLKNTSLEKE